MEKSAGFNRQAFDANIALQIKLIEQLLTITASVETLLNL